MFSANNGNNIGSNHSINLNCIIKSGKKHSNKNNDPPTNTPTPIANDLKRSPHDI